MVSIPWYDTQWSEVYPILKMRKNAVISKQELRQIFLEKTHRVSIMAFTDFVLRGKIYGCLKQKSGTGQKNDFEVL